MRKKWVLIVFILLCASSLFAQEQEYIKVPFSLYEAIEPERMIQNIRDLSSPAFEGRELGTLGNKKTVEWVENQFRQMGLLQVGDEGYRVKMELKRFIAGENNKLNYKNLEILKGSDLSPAYYSSNANVSAPFVLLADLFAINDAGLVKDKVVLTFIKETNTSIDYAPKGYNEALRAKELGAAAVLFIPKPATQIPPFEHGNPYKYDGYVNTPIKAEKTMDNTSQPYVYSKDVSLPVAFISETAAARIFRATNFHFTVEALYQDYISDLEPKLSYDSTEKIELSTEIIVVETKQAEMLAGLLTGQPKANALSPNAVLLSAAFDHEGLHAETGVPFAGANYTGSGIVALVELAKVLTASPIKPFNQIMFIALNGEARENSGMRHLIDAKFIRYRNVVAHVNLKGLGYSKSTTSHDLEAVFNTEQLIYPQIVEKAAQASNIIIDAYQPKKYNPQPYYFLAPTVSFDGQQYPFRNRIMDSHDKVNFVQLYKVTQFLLDLTWRLGDLDQPLYR